MGILQRFVLDARSGRPVTAATVDVIGAERTTTASTDNEGRYAVDALPSGEGPASRPEPAEIRQCTRATRRSRSPPSR